MDLQNKSVQTALNDIQKLELVFEAANEGFFYMTEDGKTRFFNRQFYESFDVDISNNTLDNWKSMVHPDDCAMLQKNIDDHFSSGIDTKVTRYRVINKQGEIIWIEALGKFIRSERGDMSALVGYHADITVQKAEEEKIKKLAFFDPLTKLSNRNHVDKVLKDMLMENQKGYLVYIDIQNFKNINSSFNYEAGDALLSIIADRLRDFMPQADCLARHYVDEFIVILPDLEQSQLDAILETLQNRLSVSIQISEKSVSPKFYICVYPIGDQDETPNQILNKSHIVVSYMKSKQMLGVQYYDQQIEKYYSRLLQIEHHLPLALQKKEMYVHFQPIVNTQNGKVRGFETLLRWHNAELGFIGPDEFIPIAERTEHINALGDFVLSEACQFSKRLEQFETAYSVSVNLSIVQLFQADYVEKTMYLIQKSGADCNLLIFEVTESVILEDQLIIEKLKNLRTFGIRLAIDDFGTGFSSMNSIVTLPIDIIKIDKSLIFRLLTNHQTELMIEMLVVFSHKLNYRVVAEGVETEELRNKLSEMNVDLSQGYLFSRPISSEDAILFLQ